MNILFLSLEDFTSIGAHNLYTDVLRTFVNNGHDVYSVSPVEKRQGEATHVIDEDHSRILRLKIGNMQKTNLIEKGISTLTIQNIVIKGIKQYFDGVKFDLVLYATPPITFCKVIKYIKDRDGAKTYLMLKDIFPQNAVDLGMFSKSSLFYKYFRNKEKQLYALSDHIGCMSPANVDYLLANDPEIAPSTVSVCPNVIEPRDMSADSASREEIRRKYDIPLDRKVFVYGGNLGRPQGIPFLIECMKASADIEGAFFLVVGSGTEYETLEHYAETADKSSFRLMKGLPKDDYDRMIGSCDAGMIFLDHKFTIPNFPSRLLSYMQAKLPVIACTDPNTDIGKVIEQGGFGKWCESNDASAFRRVIEEMMASDMPSLGKTGFEYLNENYTAEIEYKIIMADLGLQA
ncbi:MAG: glycosyltransferase family 4 protein [Clostridiales bacterium]|nr:glycosyltransferase family 4 protein [Clostridiales bacterium]